MKCKKCKKCNKCNSERVGSLLAKCGDYFSISINDIDYNGYVPGDIGIGGIYGYYINFQYCLDCGFIQDKFPIKQSEIELKNKIEDNDFLK